MDISDPNAVLNRQQLRDITLDDEELMREILTALIDDTSRQIPLLELAIKDQDSSRCARLAHYSKGACANVGASSAASVLKSLELQAKAHDFDSCASSLRALLVEMDRLNVEAQGVAPV